MIHDILKITKKPRYTLTKNLYQIFTLTTLREQSTHSFAHALTYLRHVFTEV
jgi:hypothetical protein